MLGRSWKKIKLQNVDNKNWIKLLQPYNKEKTMSTHSNKNGNLGANILNDDKEPYIFKSNKLHLDVGFNNDEV